MVVYLMYLIFFILLLVAVAYLTLAERKILGAIQLRLGPAKIGFLGLLQPFADGIKLLFKEFILPRNVNKFLFFISPIISFALSLFVWLVLPFCSIYSLVFLRYNVLFVLAILSLNVYGIVLAGWASNSKYAFLGGIRASSQMLSYEVSLSLILFFLFFCSKSFDFLMIENAQSQIYFIFPFLPFALMFFISALAETNRTPFDLPEAEAELVAGYNVEYSAMSFALFFLAEYTSMITMSYIFSYLFLGGTIFFKWSGYNFVLISKVLLLLFMFILTRGTLPRYRYDQLMNIGWQIFLPLAFFFIPVFILLITII